MGHSDADGLTSIAIISRTLDRLGYEARPETTRKGENAWSESALRRVGQHNPHALIFVDLGSRSDPLLPVVPTLLIDHHRPTGVPGHASLLSGYTLDPVPTSSLLAFWCAGSAGVGDNLDWLAGLGILGDLGEKNPFPEWPLAAKRYGKSALRKLTTLINAPRRTASGHATGVLQILLDAEPPVVALAEPRIAQLEAAKAEYNAPLVQGQRVPPRFSGELALILVRFCVPDSPGSRPEVGGPLAQECRTLCERWISARPRQFRYTHSSNVICSSS